MVTEPNSFENRKKNLESLRDQLSKGDVGETVGYQAPATADVTGLTGALAVQGTGKEARLDQELEQVCLATSATGAAIALVQGKELVCHASAGPQAPGVGVCLDPGTGLSGACIQTRRLQQCVDTQTDPRVNAEACRRLAVRSIVAMPLMDGNELFGIVEILSWRPNAFSERDLESLKALTNRIVETKRRDGKIVATVVREERIQSQVAEIVPQEINLAPEPKPEPPRRERMPKRNDIWTPVLGLLVIGAAILLGALLGWRERAMVGLQVTPPHHRADAASPGSRTEPAVSPVEQPQPASPASGDCGQSARSQADPLNGGLTICQGGQVIFRAAPSAPVAPRHVKTALRSAASEGETAQR
jgi:putative methionine-R-sulfoxide reductase with GAF domain